MTQLQDLNLSYSYRDIVNAGLWPYQVFNDYGDVTEALSEAFTAFTNTGQTLNLAEGLHYFSEQLPDIEGFTLKMSPTTKLISTVKTGMRIRLTGENSAIIGGEIRNWPSRHHRLIAFTQAGGADTAVTAQIHPDDLAEFGPHDYVASDSVYVQNAPCSAGTFNGTALTIESTTADTVTFAARTATIDTAAAIPIDRLDGHARTIYPRIYRSRTQSTNDCGINVSNASRFLIRGTRVRWTGGTGAIFVQDSHYGELDRVKTWQMPADSIFIEERSSHIRIMYPEIRESGDDCIALIGHKRHGGRVHDITIFGPILRDQWWNGRGMAFIGTQNCRVYGLQAEDIYGAAILMQASASPQTYGNIGAVVDGFSIKTAGNPGSAPYDWVTDAYGAIALSDGTGAISANARCTIANGEAMNSRFRGITGTAEGINLHDVAFQEVHGLGMQMTQNNGTVRNLAFDRCGNQAIALSDDHSGANEYLGIRISNVNRGTRKFIDTLSVSGGTITGTFAPGQSSLPVATNNIIIQWAASSYDTGVEAGSEAAVAAAFAVNGAWTLATVDGNTFTITGTGLDDTANVSCRTPGQAHPHAYMSLASGAASSTDGISADTDNITGRVLIDGVKFGELLWPMERTVDDGGGSDSHKLTVRSVSVLGSNATGGGAEMLYENPPEAQSTTITADSDQAIDILHIRRGVYPRSGLTTGRSDTWPTAAEIVASQWSVHGNRRFSVRAKNYSAQVLTLLTNTGLTLSGTATVAATTTVKFQFQITNATPGAQAVTITRVDSQSGLGA